MLVAYSDSDSDSQEAPRAKKRRREPLPPKTRKDYASPPPPPASFHSLYATNVRTAATDDPSLHGGRTRQVAHVEGNWPTHIYLEWMPSKDQLQVLEKVVGRCGLQDDVGTTEHKVCSLLRSNLDVQSPLHISLSTPLTLKTEQKDDFASFVEAEVRSCAANPFSVSPIDLSWASNFDGSRTFLVLKLSTPIHDDMNKLLRTCNKCASDYSLEMLYQATDKPGAGSRARILVEPLNLSDTFHISIAWTLQKVEDLNQPKLEHDLLEELKLITIVFDNLKIKTGNIVKDVNLAK